MKFEPLIHHRRSIRLAEWDYPQPGAHFVTIVTHDRKSIFSAGGVG
jgi:putative transposase